jgi:hypothetical protein
MKNWKNLTLSVIFLFLAFLTAIPVLSQSDKPAPTQAPATKPATKPTTSAAVHEQQLDDAGSRVFAQNCGRCHTPPDCFSPHISGTIVMHMRARASLSKKDEQDLLRFLNP